MKPLPFKQIQETKWEKWRAETFWTKEPETLKWIESFKRGSDFADVGANVGQYSLYAAMLGHKVDAFEPQPANYQALLRNIGLNGFHCLVTAFPFAAASKQKVSTIRVGARDIAGSSGIQVQQTGNYFMQCVRLNNEYQYVKIDVDGIELDIVRGMDLSDRYLDSVLIEISPDNQKEIIEIFQEHGFEIDPRFEPYTAQGEDQLTKTVGYLEEHSYNHRKASDSSVRNVVFIKKEILYGRREETT